VNFPEGQYSTDEAAEIIKAWLPDLKGTTLMPDGTRAQAPYERITEEEFNTYAVTSVEDSTDEDCATGACPVR
jgi:ribonucleoside-triphosphate reductase